MSIRMIGGAAFCLLALVFYGALPAPVRATTIEVEGADQDLPAPPATPVPEWGKTGVPPASGLPWVRIDPKVGFYYFVRADYAVLDDSEVPCIGKVIESGDERDVYSTSDRIYLELNPGQPPAQRGDAFVVYKTSRTLEEARSGFEAYRVQNLAVVQVLKNQGRRCLVEVKHCFLPFRAGDKVMPYDEEVRRWKRAHVKKPLPGHAVRCYVAGGEQGRDRMLKSDYILLTAGSREGVVEGQTFELNRIQTVGLFQAPILEPCGTARVIFAGPDSATAQVMSTTHQAIRKGFEAVYKP